MKIDKVKTAFKIMDANLINTNEGSRIKFNYLNMIKDEKGNIIDSKILKATVSRVYIIVVNGEIYKIGQSEDKGGIKGTLAIYENGGVKGRPSIRSYGVFCFILGELEKNNFVEFYMIYQDPIKTKVKGLFGEYNVDQVNISAKYLEEYCLLDYKNSNNGQLPIWNLQEQGLDWPNLIKLRHSELMAESTKRQGRSKK